MHAVTPVTGIQGPLNPNFQKEMASNTIIHMIHSSVLRHDDGR